ncbi:hypothetical protein Cpir12675_006542 [Ceratocystis pirilliformis]|uniref:Uncharacterized protein n=1 Tax=Ceratocystis pirilliformis TaxID=259994 RepID=A0ABR3YGV0_9PEZI
MWLLNLSRLAFMAVIFSAQAIAGNKKVPLPSSLGIEISDGKYYGRKHVTSNVGFSARVFVTENLKSIQIEKIDNPGNIVKSYEAVLSIWKDQSKLTPESLEYISYYDVPILEIGIINEAMKAKGRNPFEENPIYGITISRDSVDDTEAWNHLITAPFAKDAEEICNQYEEMSNRFIESFRIGVDCDFNRWVSINFGRKGDQNTDNTLS